VSNYELAKGLIDCAEQFEKRIAPFDTKAKLDATELTENQQWAERLFPRIESLFGQVFTRSAPEKLLAALRDAVLILISLRTDGGQLKAPRPAQWIRETAKGIRSHLPDDWIGAETSNIREAAAFLGITEPHVYRLIAGGKLDVIPNTKLPLKSSVEAYKQKCQPQKKRRSNTPKAIAKANNQRFLQSIDPE
jgi:hypothetical protein